MQARCFRFQYHNAGRLPHHLHWVVQLLSCCPKQVEDKQKSARIQTHNFLHCHLSPQCSPGWACNALAASGSAMHKAALEHLSSIWICCYMVNLYNKNVVASTGYPFWGHKACDWTWLARKMCMRPSSARFMACGAQCIVYFRPTHQGQSAHALNLKKVAWCLQRQTDPGPTLNQPLFFPTPALEACAGLIASQNCAILLRRC